MTRIRIPVLLSDVGQDHVWPSAIFARVLMQELRAARDRAPCINLYYSGAGHAGAGARPT